MSAAAPWIVAEKVAMRQKKRNRKRQKEQVEVAVAPSLSPCPPETPEPRLESLRLLAGETLSSEMDAAVSGVMREGNQEAVAAAPLLEVEEAEGKQEKKRRRNLRKEALPLSQSAIAGSPILEGEYKTADVMALAPAPEQGKKKRSWVNEQEQSDPLALAFDVHPQAEAKASDRSKYANVTLSPILEVEEADGNQEKKRRRNRGKEALPPSQFAIAGSPILEGEYKTADVMVLAPAPPEQGKKKRRRVKEQEQSNPSALAFDVHLQGEAKASDRSKYENVTTRRGSSSTTKARMPSTRKIIRMRAEARRQQPPPHGLLDAIAQAENPSSDAIQQNPEHSSPFGAFFDQFRYTPNHQQNRNPAPFPQTPDRLARSLPRRHSSSDPQKLDAKTTAFSISVSHSQQQLRAKDKVKLSKKVDGNKERTPKPCLSASEKLSDKYRRVPLDQLVPPPRSPYKLLQEKYASDPWKVIVICMLLNLTQGKQVKRKVKGFFKRYPDPQTACQADSDKMEEYLAPLGLQAVKTKRIKQFSKEYVEKEWTHITQLCGVGKYAADAYAIFCAGKATEVVPEDHKLVDYWKYVCFALPLIQECRCQESVTTDQVEKVVRKEPELAVHC